jgi:hypothetical protein
MENKILLHKICSFVIFHEERVFHLTGQFLNSKKCFLGSIKVNKRFRGINVKFYSEAFDSSTRADSFLKIMEQPLLSKEINIERWVISIERHVNPLNGFLCFKVFGRLLLSKPLSTSLTDFFSSEDYTVEYSSGNSKTLFDETLWSLASTQKHYNSLDSGAVFACNRLPVFVKVQLLWQRSINLFITEEFKRAGIQVKESQDQSVQTRFVRLMFSCLSTEAGHNLNKWLSQKNLLYAHKGSNDSENQALIYLLYVEYKEELTFLRNIINELKKFLKEFD